MLLGRWQRGRAGWSNTRKVSVAVTRISYCEMYGWPLRAPTYITLLHFLDVYHLYALWYRAYLIASGVLSFYDLPYAAFPFSRLSFNPCSLSVVPLDISMVLHCLWVNVGQCWVGNNLVTGGLVMLSW